MKYTSFRFNKTVIACSLFILTLSIVTHPQVILISDGMIFVVIAVLVWIANNTFYTIEVSQNIIRVKRLFSSHVYVHSDLVKYKIRGSSWNGQLILYFRHKQKHSLSLPQQFIEFEKEVITILKNNESPPVKPNATTDVKLGRPEG